MGANTTKWITKTKEGAFTIKIKTDEILKIWNDCIETPSPKLATWESCFDPLYGTVFFFNKKSTEKIGSKSLTRKQAMMVAVDHYIAVQAEKEIDMLHKIKEREFKVQEETRAARTLQGIWAVRRSRMFMRTVVKAQFDKRHDPLTGQPYYWHIFKNTRQDTKPLALGSDDLQCPDFICVLDPRGNGQTDYIYRHLTQPWLTSKEKPKGYVTCSVCDIFLAARFCKDCEERFCIDCFTKFHSKGNRKQHKWERYAIEEHKCSFCKEKIADELCAECNLAFCEGCSKMVHGRPSNKDHTRKAI